MLELEIKAEEVEDAAEDTTLEEVTTEETPPEQTVEAAASAAEQPAKETQQQQQSQNSDCNETTLNPLNEPEMISETELKTKHRRYWTPKEEERFFEIWGRDNWRLTKHGKNTIFFAKWAEEMKEKFNIDVKPEEVQCKVNQTRAKFRQVKRLLETDRNAIKWKKYDLVEKILKNQYRSKDDEPVPLEALENNRDMSPTELLNNNNATHPYPASPNGMSNTEQAINLNQTTVDHQLTEEISLSDHNLTSNVFSNNSQSSNSFSTELFGIDQLDIKQEIESDLKRDGFSEFIPIGSNEHSNADDSSTMDSMHVALGQTAPQQEQTNQVSNSQIPNDIVSNNNMEANLNAALVNNNRANNIPTFQNHHPTHQMITNNVDGMTIAMPNHANINNHNTTMQPPRVSLATTSTPRKRNRTTAVVTLPGGATPITQDMLESLYLEEIKKKNVILVEQGEISRKRLRLEERKVKLMEEFFPKYLSLQQEILKKLDNVTNTTPEAINIRIEE